MADHDDLDRRWRDANRVPAGITHTDASRELMDEIRARIVASSWPVEKRGRFRLRLAGSDPELPPLSVQETERIIGRIASVVDEQQLVLIGGQAIALWRAQLAAYLPAGVHTVTSRDVDLQGSRDAIDAIARLLGGRSRLASFDEHTSLAGVVVFVDADGYERQLDVLPRPFGLDGAAVARNAPLLYLHPDYWARRQRAGDAPGRRCAQPCRELGACQ